MKEKEIEKRYQTIKIHLNEKGRRLWCANEAMALKRGGVSLVSRATEVSRTTIIEGVKELKGEKQVISTERVRRKGGGRKSAEAKDTTLRSDLEKLVEPVTRGDPESPLRWTSKSTGKLAAELNKNGYRASDRLVARLLKKMDYSLQANRKTKEGGNHPQRDDQFNFINDKTKRFLSQSLPVISVDTKKKENIGEYKNDGREYAPKGEPIKVNTYDFPDKELGKAVPYGIYEIDRNKGWVNVGVSKDTAQFAVQSIRCWWSAMGEKVYPRAKKLYINADGGGSNGHRVKLWKVELQKLANETGLTIHVSHFPPGTSKWNKIEHRMFSFISKNWRGKPLLDRAAIVNLIANTTTKKGLEIKAILDETVYEKGIKVSDEQLKAVNLKREEFMGEWNYIISPKV